MIPKRSPDFSKLTLKVINYHEACTSSYFRYYVNYLSSDLLLNCSYTTIYALWYVSPEPLHELCLIWRVNIERPFFSIHIERALNHDEMPRDALNYSIFKYRQIFTKSDTIPNRFRNDVTKIDLVRKKNLRKSALYWALSCIHVWSLISSNTLVSNFQLALVSSSSDAQALQVNFTRSMYELTS